jgi:hypothetical protein
VKPSITSNFNGAAIAGGNYIWFNSVLSVQGLGSNPVTISFDASSITFRANNTNYNLSVPSARVTFDPNATMATTTFNIVLNRWETTVPSSGLAGKTFLTGLAFPVPAGGLPGGINPVTWTGSFGSDTSGVSVQWQWAAAVYTTFSTEYNALGVKPVDDNQASEYQNSDHAGTPENFKAFVIGGARGGGGSNYTGSYSGTEGCVPGIPTPTPTETPTKTPTPTRTATPTVTPTKPPKPWSRAPPAGGEWISGTHDRFQSR